jgi:hypothetical protein
MGSHGTPLNSKKTEPEGLRIATPRDLFQVHFNA